MSTRAAARLRTLGFADVVAYRGGKNDWMAAGLPVEGDGAQTLVSSLVRRDVPLCRLQEKASDVLPRLVAGNWPQAAVVDEDGILLGRVRRGALSRSPDRSVEAILEPGPVTLRAHEPVEDVAERLTRAGVSYVFVTAGDGRLIGLLQRKDVEAALERRAA